jgi:GDP-D-mannose dehydratase
MGKVALITGVTGQDGAYLSEYLIKKAIQYMDLKEDLPCLTQIV